MLGVFDIIIVCLFVFFYVSLFYNLPILAAGIRDFRRYKKRGQKKFVLQKKELPFFSLILPVKNEHSVINRVLNAFSELKYPAEKYEVVIVDDGSTDGTIKLAKDFASTHGNFRFYHRDFSRGKACALNFGLENSRGDILAIFDADNVPEKNTLLIAAAHFRDKSIAALQGRIHSINSNQNMLTEFISIEDSVWCEAFLRGKESLGLFVHLRGCCQFIRRDILQELGGFDESIMAEDIEISARLVRKGHKIKYTSDIRTWQESPSTLKGFLKQRTRWYTGHMQVALKYGQLLRTLNRMTLDAEFTLILPFVAIASFICFTLASWNVFSVLSNNPILVGIMAFSSLTSTVIFLLVGFALVYYHGPTRLRNLLWLPFVFLYWCLQSFLAIYAGFLLLLRRPFSWVKTEKSGVVKSTIFTNAITQYVDVDSSV